MPVRPRTYKLLQMLDELTALLRKANQGHWANVLEECQRHIRQADFYGVEKFLSLFGGMGSLNDLMIPVAGGGLCPVAKMPVERMSSYTGCYLNTIAASAPCGLQSTVPAKREVYWPTSESAFDDLAEARSMRR